MVPKRRAGKKAATSATEGPPPPPLLLSALLRVGIFPFFSEIFIFCEANFWLSHDESRMIHCDPVISGSSTPLIFFADFLGDLVPLYFSTENLGTEWFLLQASVRS